MRTATLPLLLLALLALAPRALAAGPRFAPVGPVAAAPADPEIDVLTELSPQPAEVGLVMQLALIIEGEQSADCALVELPETEGARLTAISGPETLSRTVRENGRRTHSITSTWRVEVVPERAGTVAIPPIRFECRGRDVYSEELRFEVQPSRLPPDAVEIHVTPSTDSLYVGQTAEVEIEAALEEEYYELRLSQRGLQIEIPWLDDLAGFHRQPSPTATAVLRVLPSGVELPFDVSRESRGGTSYIVLRARVPLLASRPGSWELDRSRFFVRVAVEAREERDIFRGRMLVATKVLEAVGESEAHTLEVRPTPVEGRPADWVDAVGRFALAGEAFPREVAVGESARLQLVLTPAAGRERGNLDLLTWPAVEEQLEEFRIFGKETHSSPGRRVLTLEISPRHADVREVPQITLSSFDPLEGRYVRASAGPFPLTVTGGRGEKLVSLSSQEERLADLDSIRVELAPPGPALPWWWGGPLLGALALLTVDVARRRRRWRAAHGGELRRRGAARALDAELREARDAAGVGSAFARFLAARLGGPEAGLTREEARRALAERGRTELAADLDRVLEGWELAYLGGGRLDVDAAREQARELARRVEAAT